MGPLPALPFNLQAMGANFRWGMVRASLLSSFLCLFVRILRAWPTLTKPGC